MHFNPTKLSLICRKISSSKFSQDTSTYDICTHSLHIHMKILWEVQNWNIVFKLIKKKLIAVPSNQNSSSTIAHHILNNPVCTAVYKSMIFTLLINLNEFQLSILEALLITRHKPELCIQKQFYTPLLFNKPIGPHKENTGTTLLANYHFFLFFNQFFSSLLAFLMDNIPW